MQEQDQDCADSHPLRRQASVPGVAGYEYRSKNVHKPVGRFNSVVVIGRGIWIVLREAVRRDETRRKYDNQAQATDKKGATRGAAVVAIMLSRKGTGRHVQNRHSGGSRIVEHGMHLRTLEPQMMERYLFVLQIVHG